MCGISGIFYHTDVKRELLETEITRITNAQAHRGPDGSGEHVDETFGLGHRRLAIIDLANGKQPMYAEQEQVIISFNGEIYNYKILRQELVELGYRFQTNSDTEVLIKAYLAWDVQLLQKLRGMFAFIIVDKRKNVVFTARDHFGIKPLMYRIEKQYTAFASEINALKNIQNNPPEGLITSVETFLRLGYIPGKSTIYKTVFKLLPGQYTLGTIQNPIQNVAYYYRFNERKSIPTLTIESLLTKTIEESVVLHTQSDVPYGVFLSGGIDSTLVAAFANKNSTERIKGFTMDFNDPEYSELNYAKKAANHSGYDLHTATFDEDISKQLEAIVYQYGEPFGDSSALPTWQISALAAKHVKVVLSGDGGDEAFAGYASKYEQQLMISPAKRVKYAFHTGKNIEYLKALYTILKYGYSKPIVQIHNYINQFAKYSTNASLWKSNYKYLAYGINKDIVGLINDYTSNDLLLNLRKLDVETFMPFDVNMKVDIASMAHSIEVRPPLLDIEVHGLAAAIPSSELFKYVSNKISGKEPLKKILMNLGYDADFVYRKKKGFTIPKVKWFRKGNVAYNLLQSELQRSNNSIHVWFDLNYIVNLLHKPDLKYSEANKLWYILVLSLWLKQHPEVKFNVR